MGRNRTRISDVLMLDLEEDPEGDDYADHDIGDGLSVVRIAGPGPAREAKQDAPNINPPDL